jgi:phosphoglycolate phosphatase
MSSSTQPGSELDAILAQTRHLLLDFDGPICSIFAGLSAATVADRLRKLLATEVQMPDSIASTPDPIELFTYSATISDELAARVEAEMSDLEVAAVATAEPTPYVHEVVTGCRETGRSVTVVSNNSPRAVRAYLAQHGLDDRIPLVIARTSHNPGLLKPDPYLINQAVAALAAEPGECTLVGDSTTDVEAAHLASVHAIGYANRPGMRERLAQAGAGVVITSLADLAIRLRTRASGLQAGDSAV